MRLVEQNQEEKVKAVTQFKRPAPLLGRMADLSRERAAAALNGDGARATELNKETGEVLKTFNPADSDL